MGTGLKQWVFISNLPSYLVTCHSEVLSDTNWDRAKDFQRSYSNSHEFQVWSHILKAGIIFHSTNLLAGWGNPSNKTQLLHQQKTKTKTKQCPLYANWPGFFAMFCEVPSSIYFLTHRAQGAMTFCTFWSSPWAPCTASPWHLWQTRRVIGIYS